MVVRIGMVVLTGFIGYVIGLNNVKETSIALLPYFYLAFGVGLGLIFVICESYLQKAKGRKLLFSVIGSILGFIVGYFLMMIYSKVCSQFLTGVEVIFPVVFAYLGLVLGYSKEEEFELSFAKSPTADESTTNYKILDTSVIIDGRIADIAETGFLEGVLVVPRFVLKELQQVADSSDPLKRSRGRRGLDILNNMKASKKAVIRITEKDFPDVKEVDSKLLKLAHYMNAIVITNDFNLNKVAEFQGVKILNINELSNSVKPIVLPNEEIRINVIKEGKDQNQGIAYLDDGTMIVVDNGKNFIGKEINVVVTSILQTPAGRMIFTQLAEETTKSHHHHRIRMN